MSMMKARVGEWQDTGLCFAHSRANEGASNSLIASFDPHERFTPPLNRVQSVILSVETRTRQEQHCGHSGQNGNRGLFSGWACVVDPSHIQISHSVKVLGRRNPKVLFTFVGGRFLAYDAQRFECQLSS